MAATAIMKKQISPSNVRFFRFSALTRRQLCVLAVKEEKEPHQTGVPLIIAPHVIRRAFIVHPSTKVIDSSAKYQWFTKTKLYEGLPASFPDLSSFFSDEEYEVVREQFATSVLQNYAFRKETFNVRKNERRGEQLRMGVLQDLMRCLWSFSDRYPHLNDCFVDLQPNIKIHWVRQHNFYQLEYKPAYIIRSKEQAQLFQPDVERTSSESLPGPFDNYSLGVYRHPIVHLRNNPGFQNSGLNKYPHNHMIFLTNTYNLTYEQQTAFGIMSMFSALLALAMDRGVKMGEHLKEPLVTKCLVTDGIQFTSMCYQLNTLSFQEDIGIKNCAWVSPNMNLFSKQEKTSARAWSILYESLEKGEQVSGFNDMCFKTILALFCHH